MIMTYKCISVEQAKALIQAGDSTILDIRDAGSFSQSNIENSVNVSNDNIEQIINNSDKTLPLIVYCYHGNSSKGAAEYFHNLGFKESYSVDGGYEDWKFKVLF